MTALAAPMPRHAKAPLLNAALVVASVALAKINLILFTLVDIGMGRVWIYRPESSWVYWRWMFGVVKYGFIVGGITLLLLFAWLTRGRLAFTDALAGLLYALAFWLWVDGGALDVLWFWMQGRTPPNELPWLDGNPLIAWLPRLLGHEHVTAADLYLLYGLYSMVIGACLAFALTLTLAATSRKRGGAEGG